MKIVHVITGLNGGGAQRFLLDLVKNLPRRFNHEVISLVNFGVVGELLTEAGVPVTALEMKAAFPGVKRPLRLAQKIKDAAPDLVHTWMYHSDLIGGLAARWVHAPKLLWSVHNADTDPRYTKRRTAMVARGCAALSNLVPDHIVYASEATRQIHYGLGYTGNHSSVIPGGYDLRSFAPDAEAGVRVRAAHGIPAEAPVVGIVARFDPQKGFSYFFEMAGKLLRMHPNVHFVAAGRGVDSSNGEIAAWAKAAGVAGALSLLGVRKDVPDVLNALDVLVSPSIGEAGPLIIGEALACGVPCVGTNVGLTDLLIADGNFVTPATDAEAMAKAVGEMLAWDPARRKSYGLQARQRILENFSIDRTAKEYAQLYDSMAMPLLSR